MPADPTATDPRRDDGRAAANGLPAPSLGQSGGATLVKHNPALLTDDLLERTFAAREPLLGELLDRVRQNTDRDAVQHYLLIGPRGSGKTTLLRLLALRVRQHPRLGQAWLPVLFAEEEFSIYDLKDFFVTIFERMGTPRAKADALRLKAAGLSTTDPDAALQLAVQTVEEAASARDRRLLLLVDNLDQILEQATAGDELATRRLRSELQHAPLYMLVGSSTAVFDELIDYQRPLYQFFAPIYLRPLDDDGVSELLRRRAEVDANEDFLHPTRALRRKVRVITAITGGSPRLAVALYDVLSGRPMLETMDALTRLMDELTPYYKARVEALPAQQRKLVDALVRAGGAANPTEIATHVGLKPNAVTSQLNRLRDSGWVRPRPGTDRRSTRYELADQLFRIWYAMRYRGDRRRYAFLVEFYQLFFTAQELDELYQQHLAEFRELALSRRALAAPAIAEPSSSVSNLALRVQDLSLRLTTLLEALPPADDRDLKRWEQATLFLEAGQTSESRQVLESSLEDHRRSRDVAGQAVDEFGLALVAEEDSRIDEAIAHYRQVVALSPDDPDALNNLGRLLAHVGHYEDAKGAYHRALELRPDDPLTLFNLGALLDHNDRGEEAEVAYRRALELRPDDPDTLNNLGVLLSQTGRDEEAEVLYRRALELQPDADVLTNLGNLLARTGRAEEAEAAYRRALESSPAQVNTLAALGNLLTRAGRYEGAEEPLRRAYEAAVKANSSYTPLIRRDYAIFFIDSRRARLALFTPHEIERHLEALSNLLEPLDADTRAALWVRYLLAALRARVPESVFQAMLDRASSHFAGGSSAFEPFRIANHIRSSGDSSALATLNEDLRNTVEIVLAYLESES